jgi:Domain of unknown function(DUF2779)
MPPIPLDTGTRPYQTIPFQWSLHTTTGDGALSHQEFLADGSEDPRRRFAETLIEALEGFEAPIVVYSAYEQTRPIELVEEFADLPTVSAKRRRGLAEQTGRRRTPRSSSTRCAAPTCKHGCSPYGGRRGDESMKFYSCHAL